MFGKIKSLIKRILSRKGNGSKYWPRSSNILLTSDIKSSRLRFVLLSMWPEFSIQVVENSIIFSKDGKTISFDANVSLWVIGEALNITFDENLA